MTTVDVSARPRTRTHHRDSRWITVGLLGLPAYGLLTLASAIDPQPDPAVDYVAWAHFVTTTKYLLGHLLGSALGLICAVLGVFSLGLHLHRTRAARLGPTAALITVLGHLVFLSIMGASAFAAPATARAYLAGVENIEQLQQDPAATLALGVIFMLVIALSFVGNVLLGVAIWRSGTLPKVAGAIWIAAAVAMYAAGLLIGLLVTNDSPPTEPIGALLVAIAGGWVVWSTRTRR